MEEMNKVNNENEVTEIEEVGFDNGSTNALDVVSVDDEPEGSGKGLVGLLVVAGVAVGGVAAYKFLKKKFNQAVEKEIERRHTKKYTENFDDDDFLEEEPTIEPEDLENDQEPSEK